MHTFHPRLTAIAASALLALSACGGGGADSPAIPPETPLTPVAPLLTGRVIDGYIRGAVVFWDCNKNGVQDVDETGALSGAQGVYQIVDFSARGCPLLAYVGPTAVDEDKPLQLGSAYTLQAVDGQPGLITAFTTLVAGKVASSGLTVAQASTEVAALFGLTEDVLVDYKASGSAPLRAAATASVAALQTTQAQGYGFLTDSVRQSLSLVEQQFADSGLRAAIGSGVTPFVSAFKSLADQAALLVTGNDSNRLVRRVAYPSAAQNDALKAIVAAVNAKARPRYGYPAWGLFSTEELQAFARTINRLNAVQSDSPHSAMLQAMQQRRNAMFAAASQRMNKEVGYDGALAGVWDFFSSDPSASLDYGMSALAISGDIAGDVLTLATPRPKVGRPNKLTQYKKKLVAQLAIYDSVVAAGDCVVKVNKLDATDDLAAALVDVVTACGGFMSDQLKEVGSTLHTGKLTDGLSAALNASGGTYGVVKEEDRTLVALKMSATTFSLTHDLLALFANDPVTSKALSVTDLGLQFLNARVAAMELERAANQKLDDKLRAAIVAFDAEMAKAWRSYFISFMELYGDYYFEVKDSSLCTSGQVLRDDGVCGNAVDPGSPSMAISLDRASITALGGSIDSTVRFVDGRNGIGSAAKFGGLVQPGSIRIPNSPAMQFTAGGSIDIWARIDANSGMSGYGGASTTAWGMALLAKSHDVSGVGLLTFAASTALPGLGRTGLASYDPSWQGCTSTSSLPGDTGVALGDWFRITVTLSSTTGYAVYVNKTLTVNCPAVRPNFMAMNAQDLYLGKFRDRWYPLDGALQDLRIYPKALSAEEVAALP